MKPPEMPPNIVIRMGTFPPKPTTGWCWKHGRYHIGRKRLTTECPSCLIIEAGVILGDAVKGAVKAIQEFSRSMGVVAETIKKNSQGKWWENGLE